VSRRKKFKVAAGCPVRAVGSPTIRVAQLPRSKVETMAMIEAIQSFFLLAVSMGTSVFR
jgi:hypothetical protein